MTSEKLNLIFIFFEKLVPGLKGERILSLYLVNSYDLVYCKIVTICKLCLNVKYRIFIMLNKTLIIFMWFQMF